MNTLVIGFSLAPHKLTYTELLEGLSDLIEVLTAYKSEKHVFRSTPPSHHPHTQSLNHSLTHPLTHPSSPIQSSLKVSLIWLKFSERMNLRNTSSGPLRPSTSSCTPFSFCFLRRNVFILKQIHHCDVKWRHDIMQWRHDVTLPVHLILCTL